LKKNLYQKMFEKFKSYIPVLIIIIIAVLFVFASSLYMKQTNGPSVEKISSDEAAKKVLAFVNEKLGGQATATLVSASLDKSGIYKIVFSVNGQEVPSYTTLDGRLLFWDVIDLTARENSVKPTAQTIGNFAVSKEEIYKEDGKPIIYLFASASCPHSRWEKPILEKVVEKFQGLISFHENIDSDADIEIFKKFNPDAGVPTLVLGGKYYRVGSGEQLGEEQEEKVLTALICKLTNEQPKEVCSLVKDLISQISNN